MKLFELHKDVAGYLSVRVVDTSPELCIERFERVLKRKHHRSGSSWKVADEVQQVRDQLGRGYPHDYISEIVPGATIDHEWVPS